MINAFSVDFEDWYHPTNDFRKSILKNNVKIDERIFHGIDILLELLEINNIKATFFILGCLAERFPDTVLKISKCGHEIASHGYFHQKITDITPDMFQEDIEKSLNILKNIVNLPILGYRAPYFTVTKTTLWALDILKDNGFKYDSSIYPFKLHPEYGLSGSCLSIYSHNNSLIEVPMSCAELIKVRIPVSGGGYFRLYPYWLFKRLINFINADNRPLIFYIHPWELDSLKPKNSLTFIEKLRTGQNIKTTFNKLKSLMTDFRFTTIKDILINNGFLQND